MLALTEFDREALAAFPWFSSYQAMSPAAIEAEVARLYRATVMDAAERGDRLNMLRREWSLRAKMGLLFENGTVRLIGKHVGGHL